ncbi:hypothetical protein G8759_29735 [Spirosoma aureum]|uniref:Uncharacterized protein n=1 Tax=Spirosoma aureum TaxID=2692134 RepID=A0A6G9AVM6_9BACT|nr:hypothetical protein [Spirosoma aureum]QIP16531.1 hypothetical protein G8759_29735 [Spirosoma aureum]
MPDYISLKTEHRFRGSDYRNHYDNLIKKKADINATPEFFLAVPKMLGYPDFNACKNGYELALNAGQHEKEVVGTDAKRAIQSQTTTNQRLRVRERWLKAMIIGTIGLLVALSWLFFTKEPFSLQQRNPL